MGVGARRFQTFLKLTFISYPDDPNNIFSDRRAWDRHLKSLGLPPIYTSDPSKVGPILVNPEGSKEYIVYGFDSNGHLKSHTEVLCTPELREASDATQERSAE